jgi:hypothetical protein
MIFLSDCVTRRFIARRSITSKTMSLATHLELEATEGQPVLTMIGCDLVGSPHNC